MNAYRHKVTKITSNQYMGLEYWDEDAVFLFGSTLEKVSPGLILSIGDVAEILKDEKHFTISIRKI